MTDELVVAGVVDGDVGLGELPKRAFDALAGRGVDFADAAEFLSFRMWQAQLNG